MENKIQADSLSQISTETLSIIDRPSSLLFIRSATYATVSYYAIILTHVYICICNI